MTRARGEPELVYLFTAHVYLFLPSSCVPLAVCVCVPLSLGISMCLYPSLSLCVCVYLLLLLGLLQHAKLPRAVLVQVSSGEEKLSLI